MSPLTELFVSAMHRSEWRPFNLSVTRNNHNNLRLKIKGRGGGVFSGASSQVGHPLRVAGGALMCAYVALCHLVIEI